MQQQSPSAEPTHVPSGAQPQVAVPTSPAMKPPRWSGKKTAIVAALALTVASVGTAGAAAAVPPGTGADTGMSQGRMGGRMGHMPPPGRMGAGQMGAQPGSQMPGPMNSG